jgi:TPP-dependent indolepyruvate ferredoxin oxidoreductase alpha subunit
MEHKRELKPYITPGSYTDKFTQVLVSSGIANVITKTILAPVERWRIISQTQTVYPLRPKKFNNFFSYLSRISITI